MMKLTVWKAGCAVLMLCAATAVAAQAQTLTLLYSLTYTTGVSPLSPLVQGADGNYYGTTQIAGGFYTEGTRSKSRQGAYLRSSMTLFASHFPHARTASSPRQG